MMNRVLASALLVLGLSLPALAQGSSQQSQLSNSAENTKAPEALPQELRQKLTAAGFSDVKVVPSSFVVSAKDKSGHPVLMHITPNSMTLMTEIPVTDQSTTGAGTPNSGQSK